MAKTDALTYPHPLGVRTPVREAVGHCPQQGLIEKPVGIDTCKSAHNLYFSSSYLQLQTEGPLIGICHIFNIIVIINNLSVLFPNN